jgi:spore germination cell wall hydrolase CwlJ-like protein
MPLVASAYVLAASLALSAAELPQAPEPSEVACLALNIYHEARGESAKGQAAVAHVTLNRARSQRYPDRVCEVVTQSFRGICQFSWYCDSVPDYPRDPKAFGRALEISLDVLAGRRADPTSGATYFVARSIRQPDWTRRVTRTATIQGHHFYR